jgi:FemAB-related protein (PEP-CTERM system-associated)
VTETATSRSRPSSPSLVAIERNESGDVNAAAWDAYVETHPRATVCHRHGWLEALRALGHRPLRLVARRRGEVCGVLPVCGVRDHRGRRSLISLPHSNYGGPLADDEEIERLLWHAALRLADDRGASRVELRNRHPTALELPIESGYATFERDLPTDERTLRAGYNKGARAAIAHAERSGLESTLSDDLDAFHRLLAASYRRLGTPVYPRRLLGAVRDQLGDALSILLVQREGRAVAGAFALRFRDDMMALFSGDLPEARPLRANNLKYHRLMLHAVERGARRFDFGRSRASNPGAGAFKRHFGFTAIPLPYQVWPAAAPPGADPNTGAWLVLRALWRSLPAAVADRLGPLLVRRFP